MFIRNIYTFVYILNTVLHWGINVIYNYWHRERSMSAYESKKK